MSISEFPYPDNEKELLEHVAAGNESAFAVLFEQHRDRIYSVAYQISKSGVIAEEIVQDVFLKVWLNRSRLNEIQNFKAYLYTIARNEVSGVLKNISERYKFIVFKGGDQQLPENSTPYDALIVKEYNTLLQTAIERLPNQQKRVYNLIKREGLQRNEVARQLELRPETVKFYLNEAVKSVRDFCRLHAGKFTGFIIFLSHFIGR